MTTGRINQVTTFLSLCPRKHNCPLFTNTFAFSVRSSLEWLEYPEAANESVQRQQKNVSPLLAAKRPATGKTPCSPVSQISGPCHPVAEATEIMTFLEDY